MSNPLPAVEAKIARVLGMKPECFITHPAELQVLRALSEENLRDFAAQHGWRAVRRIGGRQIEFYKDSSLRPAL